MSDVLNKVVDIVCGQLSVDKADVNPESSFVEDLGADSLDTVELVMAFEEEFDVEIPDDEAEKITTIQSAVEWIESNS
ncbi:MAG: acyl carrier protein [Pseudomonadota bacterium]|jgi:acyl carrier protein|nr:acyl carrier protein [Gammaproteobacteria bacterium]MAO98678.1 acyl carrier protein [Gammaproteobacteria bacterium]MEC7479336.1 acyl carrier protein [Pseudomonadota bacterium]MEC7859352.1 acyl carrier protein [Pseudomonadota bacterium]MEC8152989.1 acyl carrier protein [Pseudomonadota bacterium]|tara:strand:- start:6053 stop:6286 length:234 start_codon:yes stop_codon:yes gene_type:complete